MCRWPAYCPLTGDWLPDLDSIRRRHALDLFECMALLLQAVSGMPGVPSQSKTFFGASVISCQNFKKGLDTLDKARINH